MLELILAVLSTIGCPLQIGRVKEIQEFLTTLQYEIDEYDVLAACTFMFSQASADIAKKKYQYNAKFKIKNMIRHILGMDGKKLFVEALTKIVQFHNGHVENSFKATLKQIQIKLVPPYCYQLIFQDLFSFYPGDSQLQADSFNNLYLIYMQIKYNGPHSEAFDDPIIVYIIFRLFFQQIYPLNILDATKKPQFEQIINSIILNKIIQKQAQLFYKQAAQEKLKKVFNHFINGPHSSILSLKENKLCLTASSMKRQFQDKFKGNNKALPEIGFIDIQKGLNPKASPQQNTQVDGPANPFLF